MTTEEIVKKANSSPALKMQHKAQYPSRYKGKIPLRVKCVKTVVPDLMFFMRGQEDCICAGGNEYHVWVNSYGAVSVILGNGKQIGLKPDEF